MLQKGELLIGFALVALLGFGIYFSKPVEVVVDASQSVSEVSDERGGSTYLPNGTPTNVSVVPGTNTVNTVREFGAQVGPDVYDFRRFFGGVQYGNTYATSTTATTQTLSAVDIVKSSGAPYDHIRITPNTGALTATLPASSTLVHLVPRAGEITGEQCITNATGTAAATITLAAGTGIDLEGIATSTTSGAGGVLAIPAGGTACVRYVRIGTGSSANDIKVLMRSYINSD